MNEEERKYHNELAFLSVDNLFKKLKQFFNSLMINEVRRFDLEIKIPLKIIPGRAINHSPTHFLVEWNIIEEKFTKEHKSIGGKFSVTASCFTFNTEEYLKLYYDYPVDTTQKTIREYLDVFANKNNYKTGKLNLVITREQAIKLLTPEQMDDNTRIMAEII
jgi:hypothetical protein